MTLYGVFTQTLERLSHYSVKEDTMSERYATQYNSRSEKTITTTYTVTTADGYIKAGGSTDYTVTLFALSSLSNEANWAIRINATGTGKISIAAATNETINDTNGYLLNPSDDVILSYDRIQKNWKVHPRYRVLDASTQPGVKVVPTTNGTTAVNVFGAGGAPRALNITAVFVGALDTTAGNIIVKNGTDTVASVAKGTSTGVFVIEEAIANTAVAAGAVCTAESSSAGNAAVFIYYEPVETSN